MFLRLCCREPLLQVLGNLQRANCEGVLKEKRELLRHVPELDGVRGIAVLMVMILHFYDPVEARSPFGPLTKLIENGGAGVDLFFVLSGFLITGILVSSKAAANYFRAFYARRALRIFPLYVVVTATFFFVALPMFHRHGKDLAMQAHEQIWYWLFLENWRHVLGCNDGAQLAHFWSLAIEEQFYLLWSVVAWICSAESLKKISLVLVLLAAVSRTVASAMGVSDQALYFCTFTRMDALLLGALLALSPGFREFMGSKAKFILPAAVALSLCPLPFELKLSVYGLGASALVALAATRRVAWLRAGWLRSFGKYSYALYVLHYLLHGALPPLAARFNPLLFASISIFGGIALSYAAALLSWDVLESPFLKMKRYVPYRFPGGPLAASETLPRALAT